MKFDLKSVLVCVGASFLVFVAVYKIFDEQNSEEKGDSVLFEPVFNDSLEATLYYEGDRNYYLYGLDEVMVTYQEETKSLKEFLQDGVFIENLVGQMNRYAVYDGGSHLYRDEGEEDGISILVCHRSIGSGGYNEDVYIGNSLMEYEEGFCE